MKNLSAVYHSCKQLPSSIQWYLISKFFEGLRFFIPVWLLWANNFASNSQVSLLESLTLFLGILLEVPTGSIADHRGRKFSIISGWMISSLSIAGMGLSYTLPTFVACYLFGALGSALLSGAETAFVYDTLKYHKREADFNFVNTVSISIFRISVIIASFTGGYLYTINPRSPFVLLAIMQLIVALIFIFFIEEPPYKPDSHQKEGFKYYLYQGAAALSYVAANRDLLVLSLIYIWLMAITAMSFLFFNYTYAIDLGLGAEQQGWLFGLSGIVKAVSVILIGSIITAKSYQAHSTITAYYLFYCLLLAATYFAGSSTAIVLILLIEGVACIRSQLLDGIVHGFIDSHHRATIFSFLNMCVSIVFGILLAAGYFILGRFHTNGFYMVIGASSLLFLLLLSSRVNKKLLLQQIIG